MYRRWKKWVISWLDSALFILTMMAFGICRPHKLVSFLYLTRDLLLNSKEATWPVLKRAWKESW